MNAKGSSVKGILSINKTRLFVSNGAQAAAAPTIPILEWVESLMQNNSDEWFGNTTSPSSDVAGWSAI